MAVECSCCRVCACVILDVGWLKVKVRNFSRRLSCPPSIVLLLRIPSSKVLLGWAVAAKKKKKKTPANSIDLNVERLAGLAWQTGSFLNSSHVCLLFIFCDSFSLWIFVVFSFDVVGLCRNEKANNTSHPSDIFVVLFFGFYFI
jgi:hypothetical protein